MSNYGQVVLAVTFIHESGQKSCMLCYAFLLTFLLTFKKKKFLLTLKKKNFY